MPLGGKSQNLAENASFRPNAAESFVESKGHLALKQRPDQFAGIKANSGGHVYQLKYIQPPISKLIFCNIRRGLCQPLRDDCLGEASRLPLGLQQLAKPFVTFGIDRLWQSGSPG